MKILLGVVYYEPAWAYGGPPRVVSDLARQLVRRGHSVTAVTTDALDSRRNPVLREQIDGVEVIRFRNWSNSLAWKFKIFLPFAARRWAAQNVARFDVAHVFDARTLLNAWVAVEAARRGVPFFYSPFGSLPAGDGWRAAVKKVFDLAYARTLLGRAAALLAQNQHEGEVLVQHGADPGRIELWPLAVDPADYANLPPRGEFRQRHGISPDERVVLFVGRINVHKGLECLTRAVAAVRASFPEVKLVVVGRDDGYLQTLLGLVRELGLESNFLHPGPLYGPDVLPAYVDADLFAITPTHFEETSLAALSACACGTPVLINDRCGIPWLEEYNAGRCPPHSQENITWALTEMLADLASLRRQGVNARRMVEEKFFWPRVVEQIEAMYASARGSRRTERS